MRFHRAVVGIAAFATAAIACATVLDIENVKYDGSGDGSASIEDGSVEGDGGGGPLTDANDAARTCDADLTSDPTNCGACGVACDAGCMHSACIDILATGLADPRALAASSSGVHVAEFANGGTGGALVTIHDGGVVSRPSRLVIAVAAADTAVYALRLGSPTLWVCDARGGCDAGPAASTSAAALATFGGRVYWGQSASDIVSCAEPDCAAVAPFATLAGTARAAGSDDAGLCVSDDLGAVYCGAASLTAVAPPIGIGGFGVSPTGSTVYWGQNNSVLAARRDGSDLDAGPTNVLTVTNDGGSTVTLGSVAADGTYVYFSVQSSGTVERCVPASCAGTREVLLSGLKRPGPMAVFGGYVYVVAQGTPQAADGVVLRFAK